MVLWESTLWHDAYRSCFGVIGHVPESLQDLDSYRLVGVRARVNVREPSASKVFLDLHMVQK